MNILSNSNFDSFLDWFNSIPQNGGILLINKPIGITSFGLIKQLKRYFKGYKIGHSGTLDPLASGLMIIAIGKATKLINELTGLDKDYKGIIKLGSSTSSLDKETPEATSDNFIELNDETIYNIVNQFIGVADQVPPIFSAVKIDGKSAYKFARNKTEKELTSKKIEIKSLEITEIDLPFIHFRISVSKGFYVRKFAEDFANQLGTIGYLYSLQRTRIEKFKIEDSISLEKLLQFINYINIC